MSDVLPYNMVGKSADFADNVERIFMKTIGIKLADGSFYPVLEDNTPSEKQLELTTAHNNQTKVMVDLYRSATCSMDDAEYVDSLQIENLVARPNGEADIKFNVSLDEDNQLQAKIVDSETGNESNTTITLVSRTLEERLITDDYDINDGDKDKAGAGALAAGGLLAAAAAAAAIHKNKKESDEAGDEFDTIEETEIPVDETAVDEPVMEETPEVADDSTVIADDEPVVEDDSPVVEPVETTDSGDLPDMDFDLPEDTSTETSEDAETSSDDLFTEDMASDETVSDDFSTDETITSDISSDETISDDFTDDLFTEDSTSESESTTEETSDDFAAEASELPDMDFDLPDDNSETSVSEVPEMPDDFFKNEDDMKEPTFDSPSPAAGLNFDGLYDEETERGTPAETEADEVKKKTKVPVIICIICAIICIIATLLILFIIPSKYNLLTKKHAKEAAAVAIEQPAPEPEPQPEAEPPVPQAKEDEIVIIEKAEEVVPQQPPVAEKPKDITYKIKWGDTLWDIADTYYKNPWRYKYIARYNGIKNPDYIISGTKIIIPAE